MKTSGNGGFWRHARFLSQVFVFYLCVENSCSYYLSFVQTSRRETIFASVDLPQKFSYSHILAGDYSTVIHT